MKGITMSKTLSIICKNCKKEHLVTNKFSCSAIYCSIKCQQDYQKSQKLHKWLNEGVVPGKKFIKNYMIETKGNMCEECGTSEWNGKTLVLELEHKDGNSENNKLENLGLLCPNCHSQTSTYKGANKGNGRYARRMRYAAGLSY